MRWEGNSGGVNQKITLSKTQLHNTRSQILPKLNICLSTGGTVRSVMAQSESKESQIWEEHIGTRSDKYPVWLSWLCYCAALGWPFWFNWNYICPGRLQDLWIDDSIPLTGWGTGRLAKSQVEVNISLQKSVYWHNECSISRKHPVCVFCAAVLHTQGNLRHWGCCGSTEQAQIFRATCLLYSWS